MLTKEDLKHEIDRLDDSYLELVLRLLQQFPHQSQDTFPLKSSRLTGKKEEVEKKHSAIRCTLKRVPERS